MIVWTALPYTEDLLVTLLDIGKWQEYLSLKDLDQYHHSHHTRNNSSPIDTRNIHQLLSHQPDVPFRLQSHVQNHFHLLHVPLLRLLLLRAQHQSQHPPLHALPF